MKFKSKVCIQKISEKYNELESYAETARWASDYYDLPITGSHIRYWLTVPVDVQQKILIFDIETAPMKVYSWGLYKQNIGINQIAEDWYMLMWAAKWLGDDNIMYDSLCDEGGEYFLLLQIRNLLDEADIVVAHNGDRFDIKKLNAKFIEYGIRQPTYYKTVDTLKVAKAQFGFSSNKLDYIAQLLGLDGKDKTTFELWLGCMENDLESWDTMKEYCIKDVEILEQVYYQIRGWDKRHPKTFYTEKRSCNACGSEYLNYVKDYHTSASTFEVYQCVECGHNQRSRVNVAPDYERVYREVNV